MAPVGSVTICFGRQQDNDPIAQWVPAGLSEAQEVFEIIVGQNFRLLSAHCNNREAKQNESYSRTDLDQTKNELAMKLLFVASRQHTGRDYATP
jgi:hypothetical protein